MIPSLKLNDSQFRERKGKEVVMVLYDNSHNATPSNIQRVKDLAIAGVPNHLIAKILKIDTDTLVKYYSHVLECAEPEAVERISRTVMAQAEAGNEKSQALYLKTKGAKYGWIEKQIIETVSSEDTAALKQQVKELEEKHNKDY